MGMLQGRPWNTCCLEGNAPGMRGGLGRCFVDKSTKVKVVMSAFFIDFFFSDRGLGDSNLDLLCRDASRSLISAMGGCSCGSGIAVGFTASFSILLGQFALASVFTVSFSSLPGQFAPAFAFTVSFLSWLH